MNDSSCSPLFLGTGNSDDFFDLVVLSGSRLLLITTQSRAGRDAILRRFQQGESVEQACAAQAVHIFSRDEIAARQVRKLEWCDTAEVFCVEYETSPTGKLSDIRGWLDREQIPGLLEALEPWAGPVQEIRDEVVTARSLVLVVAPPVSLLVAFLIWMSTDVGWIGALLAGGGTCLAIAAVLWRANREPSVCHVATFRKAV